VPVRGSAIEKTRFLIPPREENPAMLDRYGPWSSALDDGLSHQLSTIWKRRLGAPDWR
jgi:hypothetical protein